MLGVCQLGKAHRNLGDPVWARNNFPQPQDPGAWVVDELEKNRVAWRGRCKELMLCDDDTVWASGMCLICITFEQQQQQEQEQEQKEHDKINKISTPATRATPAAIAATTRTKTRKGVSLLLKQHVPQSPEPGTSSWRPSSVQRKPSI